MASKLTLDERAEVKMAFRNLDPEKTEVISRSDFKLALQTMFFYPTEEEIDKWMEGKPAGMDYPSFKKIVAGLITKRDQKREIRRMFHLFDTDRDGYISVKDLQSACKLCNDKSSEGFIKKMISDFDSSHKDKLSEIDFISIFGY